MLIHVPVLKKVVLAMLIHAPALKLVVLVMLIHAPALKLVALAMLIHAPALHMVAQAMLTLKSLQQVEDQTQQNHVTVPLQDVQAMKILEPANLFYLPLTPVNVEREILVVLESGFKATLKGIEKHNLVNGLICVLYSTVLSLEILN